MRRAVCFSILLIAGFASMAGADEPKLELFLQTGHTHEITAVALSGDGKHVVTGSRDRTAILWETASGRKLQHFSGHYDSLTSVAVSDDGKHVVTASADKRVNVWNAATGEKLQSYSGSAGVALSRDGKYVLTTDNLNPTAVLWDAVSGKKLHILKGGPVAAVGEHVNRKDVVKLNLNLSGFSTAAFDVTSDGKTVLIPGKQHSIFLVDPATGNPIRGFHSYPVKDVSLSGDGKEFAILTDRGEVLLWEAAGAKVPRYIKAPSAHRLTHMARTRDGKQLLAAGSFDNSAILCDAASGRQLQSFKGFTQPIACLALSGDGKVVVAGSRNTAMVWDAASGKKLQTFQPRAEGVSGLAVSSDGKRIVTGSRDSVAVLWDAAGGKVLQSYRGHTAPITSAAINRDGSRVITGSEDRSAILWGDENDKRLQFFEDHRYPVDCVAMSADGKQAVTVARDTAFLWDTATGKSLRTFVLYEVDPRFPRFGLDRLRVRSVALSSDGKRLLTGGAGTSSDMILWDAAEGKKIQTLKDHLAGTEFAAMTADGKYVVSGGEGFGGRKHARMHEARSGRILDGGFYGHTGYITAVAISEDGKYVVTGSRDRTAILFQVEKQKQLQVFREHAHYITRVAVTNDGKQVWTASEDGTARLWDAATGKERCRLYSLDAGEDWLVVTPEGLFDGSEGAWRVVAYREPGTQKVLDDDATRRRFHRPGLLAKVWKGE